MTILHTVGDWLRAYLLMVPPGVVRGLFLALPVLLLIWVWRLPRERVLPSQGAYRWDADLRISAGLALGIQILVYALL
ncbi:MAG TPA: hypothetical protein DCR20_14980 [Planctomycetaceae bacterium]|nr:hypothetical protein [Planctomycetaceae bacterium]HCP13986.1 hypothetical protein [Planctomycetaceae bacterium]